MLINTRNRMYLSLLTDFILYPFKTIFRCTFLLIRQKGLENGK